MGGGGRRARCRRGRRACQDSATRPSPPLPPPRITLAQVLREMVGDESLEGFRVEYEKLLRALSRAHGRERVVMSKCRELHAGLVAGAARIGAAVRMGESDREAVISLHKELEDARREVEKSKKAAERAEQATSEARAALAAEARVRTEGDTARATLVDEELSDLRKRLAEMTSARDEALAATQAARAQTEQAQARARAAAEKERAARDDVARERQAAKERQASEERERRENMRRERETSDLRSRLEAATSEKNQLMAAEANARREAARAEAEAREANREADGVRRTADGEREKASRAMRDVDEAAHKAAQQAAVILRLQREVRETGEELRAERARAAAAEAAREAAVGRAAGEMRRREEAERARAGIAAEARRVEEEATAARREGEMARHDAERASRSREAASRKADAALRRAEAAGEQITATRREAEQIERDADAARLDAARAEAQVRDASKARAVADRGLEQARARYLAALEEVRSRELTIVDLQKRLTAGEERYRAQTALLESVRGDRNLYSKSLLSAQDREAELRRKAKATQHQVDQLKELIKVRDWSLAGTLMASQALEARAEAAAGEAGRLQRALDAAREAEQAQARALSKLEAVVREADTDRARLRQEHAVVVGERDVLGTQLIRRNDELALVYEKVRVQGAALMRGQAHFSARGQELRAARLALADLGREAGVLRTQASAVDLLKREVHRLSRDLLRERARGQALAEELETPLNVHRWRRLEGSDPAAHELVLKCQTLQRRLLARGAKLAETELKLREREALYKELQALLARQPGPEAAERLAVARDATRRRGRQAAALAAERAATAAREAEARHAAERSKNELSALRLRHHRLTKEAEAMRSSLKATASRPGGPAGADDGGWVPSATGGRVARKPLAS